MIHIFQKLVPVLLIFFAVGLIDLGPGVHDADARSRFGGRSFKRSFPTRRTAPRTSSRTSQAARAGKGSFGRGLMGGLLGGAMGAFLFGSLFGAAGSGFGILPMILLGVVAYFLFKSFRKRPLSGSSPGYQPPPARESRNAFGAFQGSADADLDIPAAPESAASSFETGLAEIRATDPGFDPAYFTEVASDVFFQVQAGWMRRDLSSYRHLLGDKMAEEYEGHFEEMHRKGQINKLESIAIRKVEVVDCGNEAGEDFVTVLFTANLLDYTVDDHSGELIEGSKTSPVKFAERWTWARPEKTESWKLEGIEGAD